jgi:carotenoid 1,2-hydratase
MHSGGPRFDNAVDPGGYAWWYVDALSDDGRHGITLIVFIGSVFSPYYAWARRRAAADPLNHCAFNVALYGSGTGRWAMTERGRTSVSRDARELSVGPSTIRWTGNALEVSIDEICALIPRRIRGKIRLTPTALGERSFLLDERGLHRWTPHGPCARIEVELTNPDLRWRGAGYWDSNSGSEPLENAFESWTWSRASLPDRTVVLYDLKPRSAPPRSLALAFDRAANAREIDVPPAFELRSTGWRVSRATRADAGHRAAVRRTLEDAPFYSRSLLDTHLLGQPVAAIHESLSLNRFRSRWVQCLLPFRMPRTTRR